MITPPNSFEWTEDSLANNLLIASVRQASVLPFNIFFFPPFLQVLCGRICHLDHWYACCRLRINWSRCGTLCRGWSNWTVWEVQWPTWTRCCEKSLQSIWSGGRYGGGMESGALGKRLRGPNIYQPASLGGSVAELIEEPIHHCLPQCLEGRGT